MLSQDNVNPVGRSRSKPSLSHQNTAKTCYKVGSVFHTCVCGSHSVYRAHQPSDAGWTHYCWDCSRKDEETGFNTKVKRKVPFLVMKKLNVTPVLVRRIGE